MMFKGILSTFFGFLVIMLLSSSAQAGFGWTPASQLPDAAMHTRVVTPQNNVEGPLTPEPDAAVLPTSSAPVENVQAQKLPAEEEIQKPAEQPSVEPIVLKNDGEEDAATGNSESSASREKALVLEGFGSGISLALALRDIVPPEFAYAFDNPADAGLKVSWRGGKVWQEVLADALTPCNLAFAIEGSAVRIYSVQTAAPVTETASAEEEVRGQEEPANVKEEVKVSTEESPPVVADENEEAQNQERQVSKSGEAVENQMELEDRVSSGSESTSVPVINPTLKRKWKARPGETLRDVLESWGKAAGVDVEWMTPYDYPIGNAFNFNGAFDEAVASLLLQYSRETPRPRGRLYPNLPTGPSVLMVN